MSSYFINVINSNIYLKLLITREDLISREREREDSKDLVLNLNKIATSYLRAANSRVILILLNRSIKNKSLIKTI